MIFGIQYTGQIIIPVNKGMTFDPYLEIYRFLRMLLEFVLVHWAQFQ